MSFKPINLKREEYRKYLDRTGVLDTLNKAILELFETPDPRPDNAIDFIRKRFGDSIGDRDTIEDLKRELEDSRNEVAKLERQLEAIKLEISRKMTSATAKPNSAPVEVFDESAVKEENNENASDEIQSDVETESVNKQAIEDESQPSYGDADVQNDDVVSAADIKTVEATPEPVDVQNTESSSEVLDDIQNTDAPSEALADKNTDVKASENGIEDVEPEDSGETKDSESKEA